MELQVDIIWVEPDENVCVVCSGGLVLPLFLCHYYRISFIRIFFSNSWCISIISIPKETAVKTIIMLFRPSTEKDILSRMVDIMKPELRITLLNFSERLKVKSNNSTSVIMRALKKVLKKLVLIVFIA